MIEVVAPGLRATVQDRGRTGLLRSGVPAAGPADPGAFAAALALAGCAADDAAIEVSGLPFVLRSTDRRIVAVTGRDARLRTRSWIPGWTSVLLRPGEELTVGGSSATRYAYVAVSGGIALPAVLGSRATYLGAGLGPLPRPLAAGDRLPLGPSAVGAERAGRSQPPPDYRAPVRAVAGPHDRLFAPAAVERFFRAAHPVGEESDRMGVRLGNVGLESPAELLSCGIVAGAVQVPRGGTPIVLLADHQTTGGYPIIATVVAADLGLVAQAAPGELLRFVRVTPAGGGRSA